MKQEPAVEAAEVADDVHWDTFGGDGGSGGGWTSLAAPTAGTSVDSQRDTLVKVETKYDN